MRFADLHNHLLPGVDDGSRSLDETIAALRRFREAGVDEVAVTPHLGPSWGSDDLPRRMAELRAAYDRVCERAAGDGDLPRLRFGQEIFGWDAAQLAPMLEHQELGHAGTRFLLVEFGFELGGRPEEVIDLARSAGREILVAHPERYRFPVGVDALARIRAWRDQGAWLQVNLGSLSGYYDRPGGGIQRLAWALLEEGLAHVVATDDHGENRPQSHHAVVLEQLLERGARAQAERLLADNPRRVLRGQLPREVAPVPAPAEAAA